MSQSDPIPGSTQVPNSAYNPYDSYHGLQSIVTTANAPYTYPQIYATGNANVYVQPSPVAPVVEKEKGPLDWLHDQVEEMCGLGRAF